MPLLQALASLDITRDYLVLSTSVDIGYLSLEPISMVELDGSLHEN